MKIIFEYPLQWLPQQPRTKYPESAKFGNHSPSKAGDYLIAELNKMGAKNCVINSNLQQRRKGDGFYANQNVEDAGVVVYFQLKDKSKAMACDKWKKPEHNLWALYLSVSAIRGLERWGGSEFLDGLFEGFKALPSPDDFNEHTIRYFSECITKWEIKNKYKILVKELHPDVNNGDDSEFKEMQKQYERIKGD